MIGMVEGSIAAIEQDVIVVSVAGIGYEIRVGSKQIAALHLGEHVCLHTVMNISQDAITLYGFADRQAKRWFTHLQKASGVGPKAALAILDTLSTQELIRAVHEADVATLCTCPGVGKKSAQKIIVELSGTLALEEISPVAASESNGQHQSIVNTLIPALTSLGWSEALSREAVDTLIEQEEPEDTSPETIAALLRKALRMLDRQ